ncbi:hypothetical protein FRC03_005995 [Tulasnella sp. 419]|nr:hypothetical protein FRC02_004780 [Tulasnella sp. 418]KAG8960930.1 hypothetical protein FRC03_005995 [Tulasnella sp. 419]
MNMLSHIIKSSSLKRKADVLDADDQVSSHVVFSTPVKTERAMSASSTIIDQSPSGRSSATACSEDLEKLIEKVTSIPPKTLRKSLLERLKSTSSVPTPDQVTALLSALDGIEPPPTLHCARCHKDYLEEDNMDRSCVMDHDDDSTEVEAGHVTWGCCGQTVPGDGSDGPPPGWCYEGKHTPDRSKARYREDYDSDASEDGLQSCEQKKCKGAAPPRKKRKSSATPSKRRRRPVQEVHVVITRNRGERPPPSSTTKKRASSLSS